MASVYDSCGDPTGAVLGMLRHARCGAVHCMLRHARCGALTCFVEIRCGAVLGMLRHARCGAVHGMLRHARCGADTRGDPTGAVLGMLRHARCGAVHGMLRHARCGADTRGDPNRCSSWHASSCPLWCSSWHASSCPLWCRHPWRSHRCSSWHASSCPLWCSSWHASSLRQWHVYGWFCLYARTLVGKSARDGSDLLVAHPGSIGICVHSCAGWTACIFLFVSADGRLYSGDGFSDGFSFVMAAYGAVLRVGLHGDEPENPRALVQGLVPTKCTSNYSRAVRAQLSAWTAEVPQFPSPSRCW